MIEKTAAGIETEAASTEMQEAKLSPEEEKTLASVFEDDFLDANGDISEPKQADGDRENGKYNSIEDVFKDDYDDSRVETQIESPEGDEHTHRELSVEDVFSDDYGEGVMLPDSGIEPTYSTKNEMSDQDDSSMESGNDPEKDEDGVDYSKEYEPNSKFEKDGKTYETDDNGKIFKIDGEELVPNNEYTINGVTYKTDDQGRTVSCEGDAKSTPEGERDNKAQREAGGEDRKEGDQGGHILARIFGGAKGIENMIAMRGTAINQSVYKRMENEINDALKSGKEVHVSVEVEYDGDSKRPSKFKVTYTIDGKETVVEYDNDEGSTDLMESVEDKLEQNDYDDLNQEIQDANADGGNMSVVSVKTEYDEDGNPTKVTVTIRDENGEPPVNEDRVFTPRKEGE